MTPPVPPQRHSQSHPTGPNARSFTNLLQKSASYCQLGEPVSVTIFPNNKHSKPSRDNPSEGFDLLSSQSNQILTPRIIDDKCVPRGVRPGRRFRCVRVRTERGNHLERQSSAHRHHPRDARRFTPVSCRFRFPSFDRRFFSGVFFFSGVLCSMLMMTMTTM